MKKNEFVKAITEAVRGNDEFDVKFAVTQKETDAYLAAIKGAIIDAMANYDEVAIPGLAKFVVVDVPARTARNPQTGEAIQVPAKKKVKVKVLGELKESVL